MFGHHVHKADAPAASPAERLAAAQAAVDADYGPGTFGAAQIFVAGPRDFKPTVRPAEEAPLKAWVEATGCALVVHGAYPDVYWSATPGVAPRARAHIRRELGVCSRIGARGLVVHLPQAELAVALRGLADVVPASGPAVLYLENPGTGRPAADRGYETPAKLAALLAGARAALSAAQWRRVGLCVDTAHLWSSGVDLRSRAAAAAWLADFDRVLAAADVPARRLLFHLNDSEMARGSGRDRHAPLVWGEIWGPAAADQDGCRDADRDGYRAFVEYAAARGIPAVFERAPKWGADGRGADYLALREARES